MSQNGTYSSLLRMKLRKYESTCHKAIVETFGDCLENWDAEDASGFLVNGYGISDEADKEIKLQLSYLGLNPYERLAERIEYD